MNLVLAVLGLAALCATSTAAPLGSHARPPIEIAAPAWDFPLAWEVPGDPGLNSPAISQTPSQPGAPAAELPSAPRSQSAFVPAFVSVCTAVAFSAVFFVSRSVSRSSMRRRLHRGRRVRRRIRTMAYLI